MQWRSLVTGQLALLSFVSLVSSSPAFGQASTGDSFSSASQAFTQSTIEDVPHHVISTVERGLRSHDPFSYYPLYNETTDAFLSYGGPDGPWGWDATTISGDNVPTLMAFTNGTCGPAPKQTKKFKIKNRVKPHRQKVATIADIDCDALRRAQLISLSKNSKGNDSHFYLAHANLIARNWDAAWQQGEKIFRSAPDDEEQIKRMMDLYVDTPGRYMEYCIWCTRYLRVVKDWDSFAIAYNERQRIEFMCEAEVPDNNNEKLPDTAIDQAKLAISVCFHLTGDGWQKRDQESVFEFCARQFDQWVIASGFKFCFFAIDNIKDADITFEIKSPERTYANNVSASRVPAGTPVHPPLGQTNFSQDKSGRPHTIITLFTENAPYYDDSQLATLCLHEIGHAIGLYRHTRENGDVMDRYISQFMGTLSLNDTWRIKELYKKAPVSLDAVEQFALKMPRW